MAVRHVPTSLRILMLHGYTQSGPLFDAKTKALQKAIKKSYPEASLSFPTGPMKLRPQDIPGHTSTYDGNEDEDVEAYGWWRRSNTADPPEYVGFEDGLSTIATTLAEEGPFDGVMGFSQGAAMAAVVSSLLEGPSRQKAFSAAQQQTKVAIPFPASFKELKHPPLKFCVVYSGFIPPGERYQALHQPPINTPVCHYIGSLDTVVEEDRTTKLIESFAEGDKAMKVVHPGGHFVPSGKQYVEAVVGFVQKHTTSSSSVDAAEQDAADMDVPF